MCHQRFGQKQRSAGVFFLRVFDIGKLVTFLVRFDSQAIDQVFSNTEYYRSMQHSDVVDHT